MKKRNIRINTEAHREAFDVFADAFKSVESREHWRPGDVLSRFLDAGYRAVRGRLLVGKPWEDNEAEYMRVVKQCREDPKATMGDLARMLAALQMALHAEPVDFIGPVFSELSADGWMGQHFTPHELCMLMARITVPEQPLTADTEECGYITLSEPAAGVGAMVLATNVVLRERGVDVAQQAHWLVVEIDHRAMCALYLQLAATDCSAVVVHGNTLSAEPPWAATPTPAAIAFPKKFGGGSPLPPPPAAPPGQLSLF